MSNQKFETTSLSLAAAILTSKKAKLVFVDRGNSGYSSFQFEPYDECATIEGKYLNNDLALQVRELEENVKLLKRLSRGQA